MSDINHNANTNSMTISQLFDEAWNIQKNLDKDFDKNKNDLKKAIEYLERCDSMLDEIHLFSDNETIDEVSTSELRYFLHGAILAWLITKIEYNKRNRVENLRKAKTLYLNFFKLTKNYELHNYKIAIDNNQQTNASAITTQDAFDKDLLNKAYERNEKIRRYKEQKEIEKNLENMELACKNPHIDDEQKREFYMSSIRYWLNRSIDDYKSVLDELKLLERNDDTKNADETKEKTISKPKFEPVKPYIITRDVLQAKVIGAGYPSLPVYSVEEFYDQLADKGMMPHPGHDEPKGPVQIGGGVTNQQKEEDKVKKELLEDDDEELKKQREWDEWKDENKRGAGNRYNRS